MEKTIRTQRSEVGDCQERRVAAADGVELRVRHFSPAGSALRTLLVIHGVCEHGGRYEHVAKAAAQRGWQTLIADLRGHGRSGGPRAHVSRFAD